METNRKVLITSALPYVNNEPHLGNIIGCVLSADAFARYSRLKGDTTLFICGTDEYGTATETKALEEKISCQELCNKYHLIHDQIYKDFEISFDYFGRTTTQKQTEIAQDIFLKLKNNNYLEEQIVTQLYCESCLRFLADRFVEGECPGCHSLEARGDQCDGCQKLLNAIDLLNPKCKLCSCKPKQKQSTHLFLKLGLFEQSLTELMENGGKWSLNAIAVTKSWLKEGLKSRCITRDLKWGTPVPLDEFNDKVFYVWFDAPIGYISITANYTNDWEKWWKSKDVDLYQFMGKDNTPFHTVIFPSSLIGTKEEWTLVKHISTTEYLTYMGDKFSKSRGRGVFGSHVLSTGIPISTWRYYLFSIRPEQSDSDFVWSEFIAKNNNELLKNLGNFVNRVVKFCWTKFDGKVPKYELEKIDEINLLLDQYHDAMSNIKLRQGLQIAMSVSSRGNQYLQDSRLDFKLFDEDFDLCSQVVGMGLSLCLLLSTLIYPFMPSTSEAINRQLNMDQNTYEFRKIEFNHQLGKQEYLFTRISEQKAQEFSAKFK